MADLPHCAMDWPWLMVRLATSSLVFLLKDCCTRQRERRPGQRVGPTFTFFAAFLFKLSLPGSCHWIIFCLTWKHGEWLKRRTNVYTIAIRFRHFSSLTDSIHPISITASRAWLSQFKAVIKIPKIIDPMPTKNHHSYNLYNFYTLTH